MSKENGYIEEKSPASEKECWKNLANAVIELASTDYLQALHYADLNCKIVFTGNEPIFSSIMKGKCEQFFKSEWFSILTNLDGVYLMERLRKEFENERKNIINNN